MRRHIIFYGDNLNLYKLKELLKKNKLHGKFRVSELDMPLTNIDECYQLMKIFDNSDLFVMDFSSIRKFSGRWLLISTATIIERSSRFDEYEDYFMF